MYAQGCFYHKIGRSRNQLYSTWRVENGAFTRKFFEIWESQKHITWQSCEKKGLRMRLIFNPGKTDWGINICYTKEIIRLSMLKTLRDRFHHVRISHRVIHSIVIIAKIKLICHWFIVSNQSLSFGVCLVRRLGRVDTKLFKLYSVEFLSVKIFVVDLH